MILHLTPPGSCYRCGASGLDAKTRGTTNLNSLFSVEQPSIAYRGWIKAPIALSLSFAPEISIDKRRSVCEWGLSWIVADGEVSRGPAGMLDAPRKAWRPSPAPAPRAGRETTCTCQSTRQRAREVSPAPLGFASCLRLKCWVAAAVSIA